MAIKLFPNLERISIKEHAKSKNYEDYIGVVLDKKNNNFKVVEGQFTDKKDMYRKMKARGLILRKAYERKVWEWIEANADGVIISYLMLSTAFSKWRSNNVLHKYYEKLLNDIPELNREREKGNPNTRGGDFITTDDKDAPKRKSESVDLEEADDKSVVKLVGATDISREEIPYTKQIELPEINRKRPSVLNLQLLKDIKAMLSGENSKFDKVIVKLSNGSDEEAMTINYNLSKVEKDIEKYSSMSKLNQLKGPISYNVELVGVKQREEPVISRFTDDNGNFEISSELLYDDDGKPIKNSPVIVDMLDDIFRTNNSEKVTGVKQDFDSIKVFVDGNLFGEYSKHKVILLKINNDVYTKGERTIASNATSQLQPRIDEIKTRLNDPNISEEEKTSLEKELNLLKSQLSFAEKDTKNDVNHLKGLWQTEAYLDLGNDSQEARDGLKGNNELIGLLSKLSNDKKELESYNNLIRDGIYNGKFKNKNTSYNLTNSFTPFTTKDLKTISKSIQKGEPVAEEEKERKEKLHNLAWYLVADATFDKMYNKDYNEYRDGTSYVNAISDLMQYKNSIGTGGFNPKTQSGKRNADVQIGDQLPKIARELKKLGVTIPTKEPTKLFTPEVLSNVRNIKTLDEPFLQPERSEQVRPEYPLSDDVENKIRDFVNDKYDNIIKKRIEDEEDRVISQRIFPEVSNYVSKLKSENPEINQSELDDKINKFKNDTFDKYKKKYTKEYKNEIDANKELRKDYFKDKYREDIDREIYNLSGEVYKELQKKPKDKSEKEYTKSVLDDMLNTKKESVNDAFQSVNSGANALSNSIPYQGQGFGYSAGPIKMTGQIVEDTTKSELNPKLFENDALIPEVRDGLYKIATAFKDYLDLPFEIKDIYLTGSNANYNYTDDSDIDLHLVYDFEQAGANAELLSKYLVAAKKDFNDKYDIKVKGIPVELGCENVSEPLVSTGVYSLGANAWVIKPTNSGIQIPDVDMNAFNDISNQINDTIKSQNASAISNLWKSIRDIRKDSLSKDGEFGMGNMLFKKLRNNHYLDELRNKMYDAQSKELSLESSKRLKEDSELNDKKDYSEYLKDLQKELTSCDTQDLLTNKSLISYLDGYRDKNEVHETKESNGVLNEGDVPNWKLNRALKYMDKDVPAEVSQYVFVDSDGLHLCRLKYDSKAEIFYKIPVERQEVANGAYHFVSIPELKQEISLEDFNKILYSDINQQVLSKSSLYDDMEQTGTEIEKYKNDKHTAFDNWYNENKDFLELDTLLQNNKRLRNSILMKMYKDNVFGSVYLMNLRKKYKKYYDMSKDRKTEVDEAIEKRLSVKTDRNAIEKIFTALGLDPRYVTRPIYEEFEKYNPNTHNYDKVERQWQIVGIDDVREFLHDGKFDIEKTGGYSHVNVWMKDVNFDENGLDRKPVQINLVQLSRKIDNNPLNSIDSNDPKIAYDIHTKQSSPSTSFVSQTRQTYTQRMLSTDQVKKALEFVQSKEYIDKIKEDMKDIEKKLSKLNPKKETDRGLIHFYKKELESKQKILDFEYVGDGSLVNLYDSLKSMNQSGFFVILDALNAVEDGVKVTPRYSVMDPHGFTFYIKLPTEGFTYEEIKNHGSYDTQDTINTVKKYNRSH